MTVVDYSLRMRCQAYTEDHVHCVRRGRRHTDIKLWLCWQHYPQFYYWPAQEPLPPLFEPQQLLGDG